MKKRTYRAESVEQVRVGELQPVLAAGCIVAVDVGKQKFLVALATPAGEVVKLFRFQHPTQTRKFLQIVEELRSWMPEGSLKAAMEPTGTYGDAIRHQLVSANVPVVMVSPKRTHDSQELFDGVRSLHDPKSAVLIAKLCAMNLGTEWEAPSPTQARLRALVELRAHEQMQQERCFGRIEAILSRHWPEFGQWMDVRKQKSALRLLSEYSDPAQVKAAPQDVMSFLREQSRGRLSSELTLGVVTGASTTLGVPMLPEEVSLLRTMAMQALDAGQRAEKLEREMATFAESDEVFARLSAWMGTYTAAVVVTLCDPRRYTKGDLLQKACGLNLREKSSGEHDGRRTITKRGPALVRKVLYLFALRMIQESDAVRAWYMRRRGYTPESKLRAVVAVMRKLVQALPHVAQGAVFDESKLFDLRRLEVERSKANETTSVRITPRTAPRGIARGSKRTRATSGAWA